MGLREDSRITTMMEKLRNDYGAEEENIKINDDELIR